MPPKHIAQTSTEVKKAYKQNGPVISDRTHKQLQRGYELEQRAAREREAEQRRKLAKEKHLEREKKEELARKHTGVGLATQLIGYSHTQANLKKGMEAFLGISKKRQEEDLRRKQEEKRKEEDLARKLEVIAQDIEKEPFDEDDDLDDILLDLPVANAQDWVGWADDEIDDDTLLEVHDLVMSDPIEDSARDPSAVPPRPATAPPTPTPQKRASSETQNSNCNASAQPLQSDDRIQDAAKEDVEYTRTHGPLSSAVEVTLERLPGEIVELLSQDTVAMGSEWAPARGFLHELNPPGLPPHRLRVKVGCVVVCLRDLNISSQLSKSQHVRVLRVENERLECLTLDGQLAGTKTVITRVPFPARYRNDDNFLFTRVQYPVRIATDYVYNDPTQYVQPHAFKLPTISGVPRPPTLIRRSTPSASKSKSQTTPNPSFKLPGLPTSRIQSSTSPKPTITMQTAAITRVVPDGWDDFLESGTQIARELLADSETKHQASEPTITSSTVIESAPPLSTQDFDFSLDDLDDEPTQYAHVPVVRADAVFTTKAFPPVVKAAMPSRTIKPPPSVKPGPLSRTANVRRINSEPVQAPNPTARPHKVLQLKAKRSMPPPPKSLLPAKRSCMGPPSFPTVTSAAVSSRQFSDFGMSTQEASSFFDDDDDLVFGSPPISV